MKKEKKKLLSLVGIIAITIILLTFGKNVQLSSISSSEEYILIENWAHFKCEPLPGGIKNYTYPFSESGWLIYQPAEFNVGIGNNEYTDAGHVAIVVQGAKKSAGETTCINCAEIKYQKCNEQGQCTPLVLVQKSVGETFILDNLFLGEYYHFIIRGSGFVKETHYPYGLWLYPAGIVKNVKNCNLAGQDLQRICIAGDCQYKTALQNLNLPFEGAVSFVESYSIGISASKIYDYNGQKVWCDAITNALYGTGEYTSADGKIIKYIDRSKLIKKVDCCPHTIAECGLDFKIHPEPQPKECTFDSQCGGGIWQFIEDQAKIRKGSCINNKCQYDIKNTICGTCKQDEFCQLNYVSGETKCVSQGAGYNFTEPEPKGVNEFVSQITEKELFNNYWLWIIIVIVLLLILIPRRGSGASIIIVGGHK